MLIFLSFYLVLALVSCYRLINKAIRICIVFVFSRVYSVCRLACIYFKLIIYVKLRAESGISTIVDKISIFLYSSFILKGSMLGALFSKNDSISFHLHNQKTSESFIWRDFPE